MIVHDVQQDATAGGLNASAAIPYTVSVGRTARSPRRSAATASATPLVLSSRTSWTITTASSAR